ncbi:hypothetical protein [Streptomyces sp. NBC_00009]|uniref:hypothetical protein n=1 Tax=Streptomyces sp. NBC_00009 TaxID=2975620 RepID=UPI00325112A0
MTTSTPALTAEAAEVFVRTWHQKLSDGAATGELLTQLANGMRLELPGRIVRGLEEFADWHAQGLHTPLCDIRVLGASFQVTLSSPVHAQVVIDLQGDTDNASVQQEWWLVRKDGELHVRTICVTSQQPASRAARAQPVLARA